MVKNVLIDSRGPVNIDLFVQFCSCTAQKLKFSILKFQIEVARSFQRIWSHLLKKSLMENFIFCAVLFPQGTGNYNGNAAAKWCFYYIYFILTLWLGRGLLITGSSTRILFFSAIVSTCKTNYQLKMSKENNKNTYFIIMYFCYHKFQFF